MAFNCVHRVERGHEARKVTIEMHCYKYLLWLTLVVDFDVFHSNVFDWKPLETLRKCICQIFNVHYVW